MRPPIVSRPVAPVDPLAAEMAPLLARMGETRRCLPVALLRGAETELRVTAWLWCIDVHEYGQAPDEMPRPILPRALRRSRPPRALGRPRPRMELAS